MKALKEFNYSLDGNTVTSFKPGDEVPEIAIPYAQRHGMVEATASQQKKAPANKAKRAPANKAK